MAYEPNFYCPKNIIGYTGEIGKSPTVYFMDGQHYGHITQAHDCPMNIGRETIHELYLSNAQGTDINGMRLVGNEFLYRATNDPISNQLTEWYEQVYSPPRTPGGRRGAVVGLGYNQRLQLHTSRNTFIACDVNTRPALEASLTFEEQKGRYNAEKKFNDCCGAAMQDKPWTKCGPECPY